MTRPSIAAVAVAMAAVASPAAGQDTGLEDVIEDLLRESARSTDLGNAFQSLSIFTATPGISAATYTVGDGQPGELDLNTIKLAPSYTFDPVWGGVSPYVEGTFGYLDGEQTVTFDFLGDTTAKVDFNAYTVLAGLGAEIALGGGFTLTPMALGGYSRIEDDSRLRGPLAEELASAGAGIIFDVEIDSALYGGAVKLDYETTFEPEDLNVAAELRYNHLFDEVFSASDPVLESSGDFGVFTARAELDGPVGLSAFGRELRWIFFAGSTYLPGDQSDDIGFSYFFEAGGGLEIVDREIVTGLEGASFRFSGIFGDNVRGFTVGGTLEF